MQPDPSCVALLRTRRVKVGDSVRVRVVCSEDYIANLSINGNLWLSTNGRLERDRDILLGQFELQAPDDTDDDVESILKFDLPSSVRPRKYRVLAEVDPDDLIEEMDEENNIYAGSSRNSMRVDRKGKRKRKKEKEGEEVEIDKLQIRGES